MISPRNVELPPLYVNDCDWGFKPVLKQTSHFLNIFGEEKRNKCAFTLSKQAT